MFLGDAEEQRYIERGRPPYLTLLSSCFMGSWVLFYCYCFPPTPKDENKRLKINLKIEIGWVDAKVNVKQGIYLKLILNAESDIVVRSR